MSSWRPAWSASICRDAVSVSRTIRCLFLSAAVSTCQAPPSAHMHGRHRKRGVPRHQDKRYETGRWSDARELKTVGLGLRKTRMIRRSACVLGPGCLTSWSQDPFRTECADGQNSPLPFQAIPHRKQSSGPLPFSAALLLRSVRHLSLAYDHRYRHFNRAA